MRAEAIKTLIVGADGMLGFDLYKVFPDAVKLTHNELDITNHDGVIECFRRIKPDVVINAAAYTDVDGCEDKQQLTFHVNGYEPGYIAEACSISRAKLVHFSTDYIFDGSKKNEGFWSDAGTFESLLRAGVLVQQYRNNQKNVGEKINSSENFDRYPLFST